MARRSDKREAFAFLRLVLVMCLAIDDKNLTDSRTRAGDAERLGYEKGRVRRCTGKETVTFPRRRPFPLHTCEIRVLVFARLRTNNQQTLDERKRPPGRIGERFWPANWPKIGQRPKRKWDFGMVPSFQLCAVATPNLRRRLFNIAHILN